MASSESIKKLVIPNDVYAERKRAFETTVDDAYTELNFGMNWAVFSVGQLRVVHVYFYTKLNSWGINESMPHPQD